MSTERWAPAPEDEDQYEAIDLSDPATAIGARIRYACLPWWRRLITRAPEGYQATGPVA